MQKTHDRTEMSAGSHQEGRAQRVIHDPSAFGRSHGANALAQDELGPRAAKEVGIELAAPDSETHRRSVVDRDVLSPECAHTKPVKGLAGARLGVFLKVELELLHDLGGDPSRAHLVARKGRAVEHPDPQPRAAQLPCTRRASRPAAHDQNIKRSHRAPLG